MKLCRTEVHPLPRSMASRTARFGRTIPGAGSSSCSLREPNGRAAKLRRRPHPFPRTALGVIPKMPRAADAPAEMLNGQSSLRLQKVLLQRGLVTEVQIDHALASDPPAGADFGDVLVSMRILDEHELISARAELYGMDVADLRQTSPEQRRWI